MSTVISNFYEQALMKKDEHQNFYIRNRLMGDTRSSKSKFMLTEKDAESNKE